MSRKHIWEIGCFAIDSVLCTSFTSNELILIDRGFCSAYSISDHSDVRIPAELLIYAVAHRACESDNPTSRKIESRLNVMHARMIGVFEGADNTEALLSCYNIPVDNREDLAACIWAVLTHPRADLRKQGFFWVKNLTIRAMLHMTGRIGLLSSEHEEG